MVYLKCATGSTENNLFIYLYLLAKKTGIFIMMKQTEFSVFLLSESPFPYISMQKTEEIFSN